jgi:hypothetical protein
MEYSTLCACIPSLRDTTQRGPRRRGMLIRS